MHDELAEIRVVATGVSTAEYLAVDWPPHAQLIDGEVIVTAPRFRHQDIVLWFAMQLRGWVDAAPGRGHASIEANWKAPIEGHVYQPDVWWVSEARRSLATGEFADGLPDLVVEVGSPATWSIDRGRKRLVYERGGTAELWLVDTKRDLVLVDRRPAETAGFERVAELGAGSTLATPLLPGLELDLATCFDR